MRIASGNELSPQSMPDMESSDCCSQSGRDMLFQNWFNLSLLVFQTWNLLRTSLITSEID